MKITFLSKLFTRKQPIKDTDLEFDGITERAHALTVKDLRQQGNKVRVTHRRKYYDPINKRNFLLSDHEFDTLHFENKLIKNQRGGSTTIEVTTQEGTNHVGFALCSKHDNFCKKTGVYVALGRLKTVTTE